MKVHPTEQTWPPVVSGGSTGDEVRAEAGASQPRSERVPESRGTDTDLHDQGARATGSIATLTCAGRGGRSHRVEGCVPRMTMKFSHSGYESRPAQRGPSPGPRIAPLVPPATRAPWPQRNGLPFPLRRSRCGPNDKAVPMAWAHYRPPRVFGGAARNREDWSSGPSAFRPPSHVCPSNPRFDEAPSFLRPDHGREHLPRGGGATADPGYREGRGPAVPYHVRR